VTPGFAQHPDELFRTSSDSTIETPAHHCVYGGECRCADGVEGHGCPREGHVQSDVCFGEGLPTTGKHKCVLGHNCDCDDVPGHGCPTANHKV
jgi:hypothetical protein